MIKTSGSYEILKELAERKHPRIRSPVGEKLSEFNEAVNLPNIEVSGVANVVLFICVQLESTIRFSESIVDIVE